MDAPRRIASCVQTSILAAAAQHWSRASCWASLLLVVAFPAAAGMFDKIPRQIEYQEGLIVYYQRNYDDADSACASVASQYNTWVAAHPTAPPNQRMLRLNPRATNHPSYGLGCTFDLLHLADEPTHLARRRSGAESYSSKAQYKQLRNAQLAIPSAASTDRRTTPGAIVTPQLPRVRHWKLSRRGKAGNRQRGDRDPDRDRPPEAKLLASRIHALLPFLSRDDGFVRSRRWVGWGTSGPTPIGAPSS